MAVGWSTTTTATGGGSKKPDQYSPATVAIIKAARLPSPSSTQNAHAGAGLPAGWLALVGCAGMAAAGLARSASTTVGGSVGGAGITGVGGGSVGRVMKGRFEGAVV